MFSDLISIAYVFLTNQHKILKKLKKKINEIILCTHLGIEIHPI